MKIKCVVLVVYLLLCLALATSSSYALDFEDPTCASVSANVHLCRL